MTRIRTAHNLFLRWSVLAAAVIAVAIGSRSTIAGENVRPTDKKGGVIEGVVTYRADSKRPWRYARYYVTDRKTGHLAEAVVAISGKGLTDNATSRRPKTAVVDQKNFTFIPETTAIRAGDRVKFLNSDKQVHNVSAFHLVHSFNVNMPAGGTHTEAFKGATGIKLPYRIGCVYHSAMRAWIFVFDHPWFQVTGKDGRFRLINVPPGKYTLELNHPAGELRWSKTIEVKAGETTKVDIPLSPDNKLKKLRKSDRGGKR